MRNNGYVRTDDDVVLRNEPLLQRFCLGVHHHLSAREALADVVVRVSLHLARKHETVHNNRGGREGKGGQSVSGRGGTNRTKNKKGRR